MMSLDVLLSSLYCPNSKLLGHYVEKEQFFFYSQHGPNHPTYLHILIGLLEVKIAGSLNCRAF